jgi:hypothetical protein
LGVPLAKRFNTDGGQRFDRSTEVR